MGLWFLRPTANLFSSFYGLRLTPLGSFTSTTQRVPSITLISFSTFRTLKYSVSLLQAMKLTGHAWSHKAWCSAVINCFSAALIGAFRSLLFTQGFAPSAVRCHTALLLLCFLIVGIRASGISIPLSLLMLLGWSFIWIASLTLRV